MASKILLKDGKVLIDADKKVLMQEEERSLKKLLDTTKKCRNLFYQYQGTSADDLIKYDDTENITDMSYMFYQSTSLLSIPNLNTSNVTSIDYMYYGCSVLTSAQLNTNKVQTFQNTFRYCYKLRTADITSMDSMTADFSTQRMCDSCYSLVKFIIRTMTKVPILYDNAFNNCYHFTGTVNATYNPSGLKDGRIYVPDNMVDTLKSATNWSTYADIIVPLSTLEE